MGEYLALTRRALKPGNFRRVVVSLPEFLVVRGQLWLQRLDERSSAKERRQSLIRLCRRVLWAFLHKRERSYKKYFQRFGAALMATDRSADGTSRGIVLMLGSLGPGGTERQAVITMLGLKGRGQAPLTMAVMHLESAVQRFFLPALETAGLQVCELDRNAAHDNVEKLMRIKQLAALLPSRLTEVVNFARTLVRHNPAVVHLYLDEVHIQGGLAAVATGVPRIVLHMRNLPPYHFALYKSYMLEAYRWLAAQPGVVFAANSVVGARGYEEWIGLPKGRIQLIHNGFDFDKDLSLIPFNQRLDYRARHSIPPGAPLVGTVMRFVHEKRPGLWMDIAEHLARVMPEAHFLMVGDGPLHRKLAQRAVREAFGDRLHLVGYERPALHAIAAMDVFLLTSRAEGLPNVLIEAQAMEVPVVTTSAGGAVETFLQGRTGWLLEDIRPEAAAAMLARLLADKAMMKQVGKQARQFVRSRFSVERMLDENLSVYNSGFGTGLSPSPPAAG